MLQYRHRMLHAIQAHTANRTTSSTRGELDTLACARRKTTKRLYQEKTIHSDRAIVLHLSLDLSASMCWDEWHAAWLCLIEIWESYRDHAEIHLYIWGEACSEYTGEAIGYLVKQWEHVKKRSYSARTASEYVGKKLIGKLYGTLYCPLKNENKYHYVHENAETPEEVLNNRGGYSSTCMTNGTTFEIAITALLLRVRGNPDAKHLAFFLTDGESGHRIQKGVKNKTTMTYNGIRVPIAPLDRLASLVQHHAKRYDFHLFPVGLLSGTADRDEMLEWRDKLNTTLGTKTARGFPLSDDNAVVRTFYATVLPEIERTRP